MPMLNIASHDHGRTVRSKPVMSSCGVVDGRGMTVVLGHRVTRQPKTNGPATGRGRGRALGHLGGRSPAAEGNHPDTTTLRRLSRRERDTKS